MSTEIATCFYESTPGVRPKLPAGLEYAEYDEPKSWTWITCYAGFGTVSLRVKNRSGPPLASPLVPTGNEQGADSPPRNRLRRRTVKPPRKPGEHDHETYH